MGYGDSFKTRRWAAAKALGRFRDARAVETLVDALNEYDATLREYAAESLKNINDSRAKEAVARFEAEKNRCTSCGKSWLRAMTTPSRGSLARAGGDEVVAAMVDFVSSIQDGSAGLVECGKCGRMVCRNCALRATSKYDRTGYACPRCA
jgi:hypothetical protein